MQVGQPAVAIGSPFGLQGSLTTGVISALGRPIQSPNGFQISGALQTDAAINPGNSGGPLLDAQGTVIGINAQIATESQSNSGVGFAIPIDAAKQAIPQLERGDTIRRAYLGVSTASTSNGSGAQVAAVIGGGPAAKAGLRAGDRITKVGGQAVKTADDVAERIATRKPGDVVEVVVQRDGDSETMKVALGTQPKTATQGSRAARAPRRPPRAPSGPAPSSPMFSRARNSSAQQRVVLRALRRRAAGRTSRRPPRPAP